MKTVTERWKVNGGEMQEPNTPSSATAVPHIPPFWPHSSFSVPAASPAQLRTPVTHSTPSHHHTITSSHHHTQHTITPSHHHTQHTITPSHHIITPSHRTHTLTHFTLSVQHIQFSHLFFIQPSLLSQHLFILFPLRDKRVLFFG